MAVSWAMWLRRRRAAVRDRAGAATPPCGQHRPLRQRRTRRDAGGHPSLARGAMSRELRTHVEEYLRIRRGLGFKLEDHDRSLSAFIDHLESASGHRHRPLRAALQWATAPHGAKFCEKGSDRSRWSTNGTAAVAKSSD